MMELEFDSGGDDDGNVAVFLQTMKILSSCFWQQLINFAVYVFLRRFSLPAPLSFQKSVPSILFGFLRISGGH